MPRRIATWNPARGVWETDLISLHCGHLEPFLETWPSSGTTRAGTAYELPTSAPPTDDSASSSLLPTPVTEPATGNGHARNLGKEAALLRTPTAQLAINGGSQHPDKRKAGGHGPTLADEVEHLLPTPSAADAMGGHLTRGGDRSDELLLPGVALTLLPTPTATPYGNNQSPSPGAAVRPSLDSLAPTLLPTPTAMDSHSSGGNSPSNVTLTDAVVRTSLGARTNPRFADGNELSDE